MSKLSLSPLKIFAGAGATLLVLLVSFYVSFKRFGELKTANEWNIHTYQVLLESSHLIRGLVNIQTGARGFLQTRDESFLDPYKQGQREYKDHFNNVLTMTRDRPIQQKRIKLLQRQYSIWMNGHIMPLIQMRRSTPDLARALQLAEPGVRKRKAIMDSMRRTVASIEETELALLQQRTQRENRLQVATYSALLLNGIFAIVLATGLSLLLAGGARSLQSINRRLTEQMAGRERAERQAKILTDHNEMILKAARDGITGVNQAGKVTFFNPAAEAITGYTSAEAIGKYQHDLLHHKRPDGTPYPQGECPMLATLKDGKTRQDDKEVFWHKDGTPIPIEFTSAPLVMGLDEEDEEGHGHKAGAVITFRDITERKRAEEALQELASIVRYSDDAIIGMNLKGQITHWNRASTAIYGWTEFEMIGQYRDKLVPPDMVDEVPQLLEKIKRNEAVERYETVRLRKDGTLIQVVLSLSPIVNDAGEVTGASTISREVFRSRQQREKAVNGTHAAIA